VRFVCTKCGETGYPNPRRLDMDERYSIGSCLNKHKSVALIREDVLARQEKKSYAHDEDSPADEVTPPVLGLVDEG
jgi:hypothetical protein